MPSVCFYFQVHQPLRLKEYSVFDIGHEHDYFNDHGISNLNNEAVLRKVAEKCYLPANALMLELLEKHDDFKISYSLSGVFLEQVELWAPDVLESFQRLIKTGKVEMLSETFYHSLSSLYSPKEFRKQVRLHRKKIKELFGVEPTVFRNTELIHSNEIAKEIERMGYQAILAEGADDILGWKSPNFIYQAAGTKGLKLLLKNYKLSDDIAFRFSNKEWAGYPLTAEKFAHWVHQMDGNEEVLNLFMDYETFGEHQWEDSGIFNFLRHLPEAILKHPQFDFVTVSEAINRYEIKDTIDFYRLVSWADIERDTSAWTGNDMQRHALQKIYELEQDINESKDKDIKQDWQRLQTSDHFYYMCTKWFADGDVHKYFNPYETPYDAFLSYMNVLNDLRYRLEHFNY